MRIEIQPGVVLWPGLLTPPGQAALLAEVLDGAKQAPFYRPAMPGSGRPFSVEMTNFGPLGWVSDARGYRYERLHPVTGQPWPAIPESLLTLWRERTGYGAPPQACLVNLYRESAKMGLHQDADEPARDAPVLSVSLGDTAVFRIGGTERRSATRSVKLGSGDVLIFGGPARDAFHGIGRILSGSSALVPGGGRINLTLRRVSPNE